MFFEHVDALRHVHMWSLVIGRFWRFSMGCVLTWLNLNLSFLHVVLVHSDGFAMYINRKAAVIDYGLRSVYGAAFHNGDLYLYLYPVDFEKMNLYLEVSYG